MFNGNLTELLSVLKASGLKSFKGLGIEVDFFEKSATITEKADIPKNEKIEGQGPVDLTTDGVTSFDKILHWSSPDNEAELPLAQDIPLDDPTAEHTSEDAH